MQNMDMPLAPASCCLRLIGKIQVGQAQHLSAIIRHRFRFIATCILEE